jgi:hypothetical protein
MLSFPTCLFPPMERPRGLVEQVGYWPCQTTVTHIPRRRTLSYLSTNVHRTVQSAFIVAPHDSQTYKPRSTRFASRLTTTRTRPARVLLAHPVNKGAVLLCLVFEQRGEAVKLPTVEFLVPVRTQFRESPFSSSRMSPKSPMAMRPTSWSIHRSTMCLARACRKWPFRRESFCRARNARRDGPFSPSVSYSSRSGSLTNATNFGDLRPWSGLSYRGFSYSAQYRGQISGQEHPGPTTPGRLV